MPRGRHRGFDRDDVLARAMAVFWEHGYEGSSMAMLTTAMGINSPSLYATFGSKERLFRESVELYGQHAGSRTRRALTDQPTARAAVAAMLADNIEEYTRPGQPHGCLVVLSAPVGAPDHADVRTFVRTLRDDVRAAVRDRLDRGVADGDVPAGTDTRALAAFYVTVLNGLSLQARDGRPTAELTATADAALAAWDVLAPAAA
ncbi:MAG TPA: TetR/AcrR family transcriptional regulator [Actinocatenispora sp.]